MTTASKCFKPRSWMSRRQSNFRVCCFARFGARRVCHAAGGVANSLLAASHCLPVYYVTQAREFAALSHPPVFVVDSFGFRPIQPAQRTILPNPLALNLLMDC